MSPVALPSVTGATFAVDVEHKDNALLVELRGTADIPAKSKLDPLMERVHVAAQEVAAGEVVVNLLKLEFMNSSCFKTLVTWITSVQELPNASQYRICFRTNREILWQRRSLQALKCVAEQLVRIEE
jgi:anti-anti-sigma factor